ncbi:MAG: aminotransferase class I/II-fold pyridoxal phosphate-dependent enzyme [Firmicutes bacterium]|nr:aminotransferase class I/II-fold pyridoxal phosphate-dependent enzyme [Bacillota bacterium]
MFRYEHGGNIYGPQEIRLDYSVNLNPLGMPEAVRRAIAEHIDEYAQYPDPFCRKLTRALAEKEETPQEWLLCGNGAADLIIRLCFALQCKQALVCAPTFSEYANAVRLAGGAVKEYPLREEKDFRLDEGILRYLDGALDTVFLCNPNNPNGALIDGDLLQAIAAKCLQNDIFLIVDECFLPFTGGCSVKELLPGNPRLVILNAFTKIYAMAGLRLGYIVTANAQILAKTAAFGQSWSVSGPAQAAGLAALQVPDWQERTRQIVAEEKAFMEEALKQLHIRVFPSDSNFLLLQHEKPVYDLLLSRGVLIRDCGNFSGLTHDFFRIGLKRREENMTFLSHLQAVLTASRP